MEKDIAILKRVVLEGDGKDSLIVSIAGMREDQKYFKEAQREMAENLSDISTGMSALVKFQTETETARMVKNALGKKIGIKSRWAIGVLVTVCLGLLTALIAVLVWYF